MMGREVDLELTWVCKRDQHTLSMYETLKEHINKILVLFAISTIHFSLRLINGFSSDWDAIYDPRVWVHGNF